MNRQQDSAQAGTSPQTPLLFKSSLMMTNASDTGESFAPRHDTSTSDLKKSFASFGDDHIKLLSPPEFQATLTNKSP